MPCFEAVSVRLVPSDVTVCTCVITTLQNQCPAHRVASEGVMLPVRGPAPHLGEMPMRAAPQSPASCRHSDFSAPL